MSFSMVIEMKNETVSPETVSPEAVSPETVSPEAVSPEAVSPEAVSPEAVSPEAVSPKGGIDDVINNFVINTSSFMNRNGVQIENCLSEADIKQLKEAVKREAKQLNLNSEQAKQFCQDIYNVNNYDAFVNMRSASEIATQKKQDWLSKMQPAFGETGSDRWNKNMESILKGATIAKKYNSDINAEVFDGEIESLKQAGFSETLKALQTQNVLEQELTKRQNTNREEVFYKDILNNPNMDDPEWVYKQARKRNEKIFQDPSWKDDEDKVAEVEKNDKIIRSYHINRATNLYGISK